MTPDELDAFVTAMAEAAAERKGKLDRRFGDGYEPPARSTLNGGGVVIVRDPSTRQGPEYTLQEHLNKAAALLAGPPSAVSAIHALTLVAPYLDTAMDAGLVWLERLPDGRVDLQTVDPRVADRLAIQAAGMLTRLAQDQRIPPGIAAQFYQRLGASAAALQTLADIDRVIIDGDRAQRAAGVHVGRAPDEAPDRTPTVAGDSGPTPPHLPPPARQKRVSDAAQNHGRPRPRTGAS